MQTILVTGSYGQLGNEIRDLSGKYHEFRFAFHDADTLDITRKEVLSRFLKKNRFDCIINCAGYTAVDEAEKDRDSAFLVNATAAGYLAELAGAASTRMIHISTDYVFDGNRRKPYKENDPCNPLSVYGRSKLAGEEMVLQYAHHMVVRTSWLYSAYGANFVRKMLLLGRERDSVSVVDDQTGSPTFAGDLADTLLGIIRRAFRDPDPDISGLYHYANGGECSWYDLAGEIFHLTGNRCRVLPIPSAAYPQAARRPGYSVLDTTKIKTAYGVVIPHWKESLSLCLKKISRE